MPEAATPEDPYTAIVDRLSGEFSGVHPHSTVVRCVDAARYGAQEVFGEASTDLVERIARQHLRVLVLAHTPPN